MLIAFPFWLDALSGNVIIFVVLAAWWAVKGNPVATGLYLGLCLLMPRPLMVPLAACLLWQRPEWRCRFAGMFAVHAVAVAASGMADSSTRQLFETAGGALYDHHQNLGASPMDRRGLAHRRTAAGGLPRLARKGGLGGNCGQPVLVPLLPALRNPRVSGPRIAASGASPSRVADGTALSGCDSPA